MNQEIKAVVDRLRDSTEEAQGHDFKFVADARVEDMQVLLAHLEAASKDTVRMDFIESGTSRWKWVITTHSDGAKFVCRNSTSGKKTAREAIDHAMISAPVGEREDTNNPCAKS